MMVFAKKPMSLRSEDHRNHRLYPLQKKWGLDTSRALFIAALIIHLGLCQIISVFKARHPIPVNKIARKPNLLKPSSTGYHPRKDLLYNLRASAKGLFNPDLASANPSLVGIMPASKSLDIDNLKTAPVITKYPVTDRRQPRGYLRPLHPLHRRLLQPRRR